MEMSGLVPDRDRILEVAMVVTDSDLNTIAEAPVYVVHQPDEVLDAMDSWNKSTHGRSGLVDKVKASALTEAEVESRLIEFLKPIVPAGMAPLAGKPLTVTVPVNSPNETPIWIVTAVSAPGITVACTWSAAYPGALTLMG